MSGSGATSSSLYESFADAGRFSGTGDESDASRQLLLRISATACSIEFRHGIPFQPTASPRGNGAATGSLCLVAARSGRNAMNLEPLGGQIGSIAVHEDKRQGRERTLQQEKSGAKEGV